MVCKEASSKGCCLNPKGWCFSASLIIYLAPRKEDPGMYTYLCTHGFHYPVPHSNPFARIIWMCFHGSILVAQRFLEINFQMMFLVQHVSYSVLWITFKFSMWCFQAMKKYVIYCNYKKTVVCWWNWVAIHVCKLNTERRWPQWSQVRFPSTIRCFFFWGKNHAT